MSRFDSKAPVASVVTGHDFTETLLDPGARKTTGQEHSQWESLEMRNG